jgi:hypothetical protein
MLEAAMAARSPEKLLKRQLRFFGPYRCLLLFEHHKKLEEQIGITSIPGRYF